MFKNSKYNLKQIKKIIKDKGFILKKNKTLFNIKDRKIDFKIIKKIIHEKGFILKNRRNFLNFGELKSLYYTVASSLVLILVSFLLPLSIGIKEDLNLSKKTVENSSNLDFQKVLDEKPLKEDLDKGLDTKNLFEDIFSFDEIPTDTVRLSASTVK